MYLRVLCDKCAKATDTIGRCPVCNPQTPYTIIVSDNVKQGEWMIVNIQDKQTYVIKGVEYEKS